MSTPDFGRAMRDRPVSTVIATGFGIGFFPFAPGTAASALGLAFAWLLTRTVSPPHTPSLAAALGLLMSGLLVAAGGVPAAGRAARALGSKDPRCVVVDEIAGQLLASAVVPLFAYPSEGVEIWVWIASFLAFRLFDVWKPGPIRRWQDLPGGWGIVVDDVLAGILAAGLTAGVASFASARPPWI